MPTPSVSARTRKRMILRGALALAVVSAGLVEACSSPRDIPGGDGSSAGLTAGSAGGVTDGGLTDLIGAARDPRPAGFRIRVITLPEIL